MSEKDDERLSRAAMKFLSVPAPADLKEELKRRARARPLPDGFWTRSSLVLGLGRRPAWAYIAGAAFAAAGVAVLVLRALPERPRAAATYAAVTETPDVLADLWADDDGEDHD